MKILFIGDIVGEIGRKTVAYYLPQLKKIYRPQLTIANAENSANGKGITQKIYKELLQYGIDILTMGNHIWDNRDIFNFIQEANKLIRPANFPKGTVGKGYTIINVNQEKLAIINLQGRVFMQPLDDPFSVVQEIVKKCREVTPNILIDFHAEVTSEKQAMGWFLDGKVSAIVGTHTHVQTADARILPNGTAYLTDAGMTGAYDSILGMKKEPILQKFQTQMPCKHEVVENGRTVFSACLIDIDEKTGKAKKITPILINEDNPLK